MSCSTFVETGRNFRRKANVSREVVCLECEEEVPINVENATVIWFLPETFSNGRKRKPCYLQEERYLGRKIRCIK